MNDRLKDMDIVMIALQRWDDPVASHAFSLAKAFAADRRVFYLEHPFTLKDLVRRYRSKPIKNRRSAMLIGKNKYVQIPGAPENLVYVVPRVVLPINWLPKGRLYRVLQALNRRIFVRTLRRLVQEYEIGKYILINNFNPFYEVRIPDDIRPSIKVYQCIDDIRYARYLGKHGPYWEEQAVAAADIVFATSSGLVERHQQHAKNVFLLPNAVDFDLFYPGMGGGGPQERERIIMYTGALDSRIDYSLMRKLVRQFKDCDWFLIGPKEPGYEGRQLERRSNVHIVGARDHGQLPALIRAACCLIIPYDSNHFTKSIYPLKIHEYLATGKPVVSTHFSPDIGEFKGLIYLSKSHEEFARLLRLALEENDEAARNIRIACARRNTWNSRVETFWKVMRNHIEDQDVYKNKLSFKE